MKSNFDEENLFLYIDLETTGLDFTNDRVCQIGAFLPNGKEMDVLVNPQMPIPKFSTEIHGITDEMVKNAPCFQEISDEIIEALETAKYFVAYNFLFDFQMLQAELARLNYDLDENKYTFVDPYKIFRKQFPHTLSNAYKHYTGKTFENAHNALADVTATKEVLEAQKEHYPDLFSKSLEEIQIETIGETGILGKWFESKNGEILFRQGKHRKEAVNSEHESYLKWILGLEDTTISEKRFIKDKLNIRIAN